MSAMSAYTLTPISFTKPLEIGLLYRSGKEYYIAVDANRLVTYRRHKFAVKIRKMNDIFYLTRKFSVDDLCKMWKISIEQLDQMSAHFLPTAPPVRTAPQGQTRRNRDDCKQTLKIYEDLRRNKRRGSGIGLARMPV